MSRKFCLILLGILFTPIFILLMGVLFYWYVPKSNVYYIPQKNVYIKITETIKSPNLNIVLGYTPKLSQSKQYDSFKFGKFAGGDFIISLNEDILYFDYNIWQRYDDNGKEYMDTIKHDYHLNPVKFKMTDEILYGDTMFYERKDTLDIPKLKKEYIGVIIHGRNYVVLKASGDSIYERIKPIK